MGFQSTTLAFAVQGLSGPQKAVLVALAHCRNDKSGRCNPGHATLARMTSLGEKTVRRALADLEDNALGLISRAAVVVGNERKGTDYTLHLAQAEPPVSVTPGQSDHGSERPEGVVGVTAGVVTESATPGQSDHLTGREQEGTGREQEELFVHHEDAPAEVKPDYSSEFEDEFWPVFPRKQAKAPAAKAFAKARTNHSLETIMAGVRAYALVNAGGDKTKIKLPAGWLNDERFADEEQIPNVPEPAQRRAPEQRARQTLSLAALPVAPRLDDHVHEFVHGCCIRCGHIAEERRWSA
ncbi:helix-turn-helix domain-containing protein [Agromyces subbeticus]|uniref:helix-turn-helix domain-containing protein n=1 Tax=Agromyces subbeticus TaxID=293890 RepID=UPI0003B37933|nr:helix-turn-helix domain-containing protein [Agromyces subbeticus]